MAEVAPTMLGQLLVAKLAQLGRSVFFHGHFRQIDCCFCRFRFLLHRARKLTAIPPRAVVSCSFDEWLGVRAARLAPLSGIEQFACELHGRHAIGIVVLAVLCAALLSWCSVSRSSLLLGEL